GVRTERADARRSADGADGFAEGGPPVDVVLELVERGGERGEEDGARAAVMLAQVRVRGGHRGAHGRAPVRLRHDDGRHEVAEGGAELLRAGSDENEQVDLVGHELAQVGEAGALALTASQPYQRA